MIVDNMLLNYLCSVVVEIVNLNIVKGFDMVVIV